MSEIEYRSISSRKGVECPICGKEVPILFNKRGTDCSISGVHRCEKKNEKKDIEDTIEEAVFITKDEKGGIDRAVLTNVFQAEQLRVLDKILKELLNIRFKE
jgi:hypothetical protein